MIGSLAGTVSNINDGEAIINVNGFGVEVSIPTRLLGELRVGDDVNLFTHFHVTTALRSIEITIYGFTDERDRAVFRHLLGVNKLGPRTAVAIISHLSGVEIANAIQSQNQSVLSQVPGIGKKMASSILFQLADSVAGWNIADGESVSSQLTSTQSSANNARSQSISALRHLGFSRGQAESAVGQVFEEDLDVNTLTYRALTVVRQL